MPRINMNGLRVNSVDKQLLISNKAELKEIADSNKRIEQSNRELIRQQERTIKHLRNMGMNVSIDKKGFMASQKMLEEKTKRKRKMR